MCTVTKIFPEKDLQYDVTLLGSEDRECLFRYLLYVDR